MGWSEMRKARTKRSVSFEDYLFQLADEAQPLSIASLYRLSSLAEDDLALLEIAWLSLPERRRYEITRHLADLAESNFEVEFEALFWIGLRDSQAQVREAAIDGLWISEDAKLVAPLLNLMLKDPAPNVRAAAASSLARFVLLGELEEMPASYSAVVQSMLDALRVVIANPDEDIDVKRRAVEAISYSGADDVPDIILAAYHSPDERMRVSALCGMGRSADERWIDAVVQTLDDPNPELRYEAARAAGELEIRKAVPHLATLLDDPDRQVQEVTIWALGQIGGQRASKLLQECYDGEDEWLSDAAEDAMEEMSMMRGVDLPLFEFDPYDDEAEDNLDLDLEMDDESDQDWDE
jgi:HEAT repeat protein